MSENYPDQSPIIMIEDLSGDSDNSLVPPPAYPPSPFLTRANHERAAKRQKFLPINQGMRQDFSEDNDVSRFQLDPIEIDEAVDAAITSSSVSTLKTLVRSSNQPLVDKLHIHKTNVHPPLEKSKSSMKPESFPASNLIVNMVGSEGPTNSVTTIAVDAASMSNSATEPVDEVDDLPEMVSIYVKLEELPKQVGTLSSLTQSEIEELELALQLDSADEDEGWKDDWNGNLMLFTKDISNPILRRRKSGKLELTQPLWEWAKVDGRNMRLARNLLSVVYHTKGTPPTAKRIFAHVSLQVEAGMLSDIFEAVKRVTYDPCVLREDGWTTAKSKEPQGASGGSFHIGTLVHWQGFEAVVIAYVHDDEFGDLWKAMWFEGFETFDLEAGELFDAKKKWERKNKSKADKRLPGSTIGNGSTRFSTVHNFTVEGIAHGIVLATTYNPQARQGVFWPARVMHASELDKSTSQGKRNSSKGKVNVVFLCPYWNTNTIVGGKPFASGAFANSPLLEMDSIEVSEQTIQKYTYEGSKGLNIRQLRVEFRFTGLPKHYFSRFLDSHRLALALKTYAQNELIAIHSHQASAALFDTHILAIQTAKFPSALLHLPFDYILLKLPVVKDENSSSSQERDDNIEPTLQLREILKTMAPPHCWGQGGEVLTPMNNSSNKMSKPVTTKSPTPRLLVLGERDRKRNGGTCEHNERSPDVMTDIGSFASQFLLDELIEIAKTDLSSSSLLGDLGRMISRIFRMLPEMRDITSSSRIVRQSSLLRDCLRMKCFGEDVLSSDKDFIERDEAIKVEWRKCCERIFRSVTINCSFEGVGNGVTIVLSDTRCNEHITENCVERSVRLPAALKGARMAGAGTSPSFVIIPTVDSHYFELAESHVVNKAHSSAYLRRMKSRCLALSTDAAGESLTADSDGIGGGDTNGSRGTWKAAIAGVAAALKAVDMIVGGLCVNVFCATRPPGHHAGRELHAMTAISNGFCILNPVACAAIYATTPQSEGGMGLKRVCVIDWDVHHGNGTQDILCATHDPRFLYVSLHAGGALINGYETDESDEEYRVGSIKKPEGIFPGRCGDTSPHKGVLNIPLGTRVTPHDVGNALVTQVEPAVEEFAPDLIILSAGFDAHKNDPLGMGGLSAVDFGHITEVACAMAFKCCSGRMMSVLEGGYGVPCCRPQTVCFLPPIKRSENVKSGKHHANASQLSVESSTASTETGKQVQASRLVDLGEDLPDDMDDQVQSGLLVRLEKCHQEGFIDCVREHVLALHNNSRRE